MLGQILALQPFLQGHELGRVFRSRLLIRRFFGIVAQEVAHLRQHLLHSPADDTGLVVQALLNLASHRGRNVVDVGQSQNLLVLQLGEGRRMHQVRSRLMRRQSRGQQL